MKYSDFDENIEEVDRTLTNLLHCISVAKSITTNAIREIFAFAQLTPISPALFYTLLSRDADRHPPPFDRSRQLPVSSGSNTRQAENPSSIRFEPITVIGKIRKSLVVRQEEGHKGKDFSKGTKRGISKYSSVRGIHRILDDANELGWWRRLVIRFRSRMPYLRSCESICGVATRRREKIGGVFAAPPPPPEKKAVRTWLNIIKLFFSGKECFKICAREVGETGVLELIRSVLQVMGSSQMYVVTDIEFILSISLLNSSRRDALIAANRVKVEEEDGFVPEPLEEAECTRGVCALP
ncbi:hypothetical protein G5I_03583 [Acromyrmex echinatior]|uniref:Uncharacterized protein n=1 Tax=Acromyrmex echinatior TaxID=103372 RepID=F4WDD0_ACREC|nr:hypothetical protein G5I_03583 [Acromyrmex echinatior]